jgi:hypothetical protein
MGENPIQHAQDLNTIIMTSGGWGLAAVMIVLLILYHLRTSKILDQRHTETNANLVNVTTAMVNSTNTLSNIDKKVDEKFAAMERQIERLEAIVREGQK